MHTAKSRPPRRCRCVGRPGPSRRAGRTLHCTPPSLRCPTAPARTTPWRAPRCVNTRTGTCLHAWLGSLHVGATVSRRAGRRGRGACPWRHAPPRHAYAHVQHAPPARRSRALAPRPLRHWLQSHAAHSRRRGAGAAQRAARASGAVRRGLARARGAGACGRGACSHGRPALGVRVLGVTRQAALPRRCARLLRYRALAGAHALFLSWAVHK